MRQVARMKFIIIMGLLFAVCVFAQRDLGTIVGTVTDPQGGAIANAKVTITEDATALTYELTTNAIGEFVRPALKPGTYTVTAEAAGFRRVAQQNIVLVGGDRVAASLQLPVGNVTESIEVSAQAPVLQTESTTLGAALNSKSVADLPLGGQRVFSFLARLSPGVLTAENGARDALAGGFSANGVRSNGQNNFLLNGVDNNVNVIDFLNQAAFVVGPSVEAIGEMSVLTNGYNAEYGRGAGGVVNVNLKSGTNEIHGVLFENLQNADLNANTWEYNASGTPRGAYRQNQFGAAVGGPIIKNRTFIFGDYQGTRITAAGGIIPNLGNAGYYTIPTAAMKNGDFSSLLPSQLYDPSSTTTAPDGTLTRTPFAGNQIPATRMDPVAAKIMALYPNTNQPILTGGYPRNDYFVSTDGTWVTDQGDVRVDHRLTDKDNLFGSMSWADTNKTNTAPFPGALDGATFAGVPEQDLNRNGMVSWTRVWKPNLISETRLAFTRLVTSRLQTANADKDLFTAFGIGGYNPTTTLNGGLPQIQFTTQSQVQYASQTYSQIGANDWLPSKEYSNVWDFIENVSINHGSHAFKVGGEVRQIRFPFFQVPYPHGEWYFTQNETANPLVINSTNNGGDQMASFLLGNINWGQISTTNFISSQKWAYAFYGQDDWKVTPKLTVSLGLRYELFSPINEGFGRQSNFDYDNLTLVIPEGPNSNAPLPPNFATAFPNVKVSRGQTSSYLIPWDKADFGPRIGIAYNWRPKTVFRIGYGIFYGGEEQQGGNPNRGESVPFNESPQLFRSPDQNVFDQNPYFTGGLAGGFPSNVFELPAPISFRSLATDFRNTLVHKWNIAVQHELPGQMALEVAYVGNHTAHALLQPDQNACPNVAIANVSCDAYRPVPYIYGLNGTASFGFGNYAGMTATLTKHYSAGLQLLAAYTYGHALSDSGTTLSGSPGFGALDNTNISGSYSSAAWDIRHNFTASFTYDVPFGKGKKWGANMNRGADMLLANWQINGILTLHTGGPFTINGTNCVGLWAKCMPDLVAGMNPQNAPSGGRSPSEWFDTSAVTIAAPLTQGNLGLQSNTGPPTRTLDISLFKDFPFTERWRLQFRAESFNVANTPQFGYPDNNLSDGASFGTITSTQTGTARRYQFALRLMF